MVKVKFKKINPEAKIPSYAHEDDAGLDVFSCEDVTLMQGERKIISTGISSEIPSGYAALIWDKSGLAGNKGIKTMAGVIDSGYRGEWRIVLLNTSIENYEIRKGDKIAQALIQPVEKAEIEISEELTDSARNEGGFGSTGIRQENNPKIKQIIIGLTGTKASGKGEVAEMLKKLGFSYYSLSDRVREEAAKKGLSNCNIKDLQDIGNELRIQFGLGILAARTLNAANEEKIVIDGIRNLGEIAELKKKNAIIIAVDAPLQSRFNRLISRNRASDPKNWMDFIEMDRRDKGVGERNEGQQVDACIEKADYKIFNDSSLEELNWKIQEVLNKILS